MIFEQIEIKGLSHFSYIIGSEESRKIAVVDPKRDIDTYLEFAAKNNLTIAYVLETHIHADYASGASELAEKSGAQMYLSQYDQGEQYEVSFPHLKLSDQQILKLGAIEIKALHTPGHTPEHLSFLVSEGSDQRLLSGDFLFIGSVGRPDLLGEKETHALAEKLYSSIQNVIPTLSDDVKVYPAHGAGSMCGAGMKAALHSTIGAERTSNRFLAKGLGKDEFIAMLLGTVPPLPPYYKRMKILNSKGAPHLRNLPGSRSLPLDKFEQNMASGAFVIDARDFETFGAGHIPNSLNIGAGPGLSTWAAWMLPEDARLLLISPSEQALKDISRSLIRVGFDNIEGYLQGGYATWTSANKPTSTISFVSPIELNERLSNKENISVLDVRYESEWNTGHIPGAVHVMAGQIESISQKLPSKDSLITVTCAGGYRSLVAASMLERLGYKNLLNLDGGMSAWTRANLPLEN